ncbi:MAG: flavodoxin domain-containing protein [Halorhabdus sp.]
MVTVLVACGTSEGQTEKVAERIGDRLIEQGHRATVRDLAESEPDPAAYDAVLIGSSIHMGDHHSAVESFVTANQSTLATRPTGLFQVSLSSASDDADERSGAAEYVEEFTETTGFDPDRVGLFGGALRYSKYGFVKRFLMKRIAGKTSGDTDTSRDYEYTDWSAVEQFPDDFAAFVVDRLGQTGSEE